MTTTQIFGNLRKFISVVDELRDVGLQRYVNLPRICVVGTQSAGKSSVLESIVGLNFLPRGDGVVTRRPLELRLVHLADSDQRGETPWAVFDLGQGRSQKFTDFNLVREYIERLTDDVAGKNKGIVDSPIVLTVYGRECPDLTLIDLPGITRVPLKGTDQTDDVEGLTRDMAMRYANDQRTIVLAVVPANADISTADALQLGRKVDPKGLRTIGVITKIDLMDRGTDAARMLMGEEVPLRLGYTGVKNRSQQDIKDGKSIAQTVEDEKIFFSTHPVYRTLPPSVLGTKALVDKLTKVIFRHIKAFLPEIKSEIDSKSRSVRGRLDELGEGVPTEQNERVQLMWTMINDYCEIFKNTIRGKYDKRLQIFESPDLPRENLKEYTGGAQVRTIFNDLLEEFVDKEVTSSMTDYDIDRAIRIHEGDSLPGFPSTDTFEYLILPHLSKIHAPIIECLDRVSQSLETLYHKIANRVFGRFPGLAEQVLDLSQAILAREKETTKTFLENLVTSETGYLFTNDYSYLKDHGAMIPMNERAQNQQQVTEGKDEFGPVGANPNATALAAQQRNAKTERAAQLLGSVQQSVGAMWGSDDDGERSKTRYSGPFIREIRARLDSYFNIVLRNVRDSVPKAIGTFLVRQLQDKLQFELYTSLNNPEVLSSLLGEPPHIMEERKALQAQMETLRRALLVLQRDPHIASVNMPGVDDDDDDPRSGGTHRPDHRGARSGAKPRHPPSGHAAQASNGVTYPQGSGAGGSSRGGTERAAPLFPTPSSQTPQTGGGPPGSAGSGNGGTAPPKSTSRGALFEPSKRQIPNPLFSSS